MSKLHLPSGIIYCFKIQHLVTKFFPLVASWLPNKKVNFESCSWSLLASVQHFTFYTFFFAYLNFLWTSSSLHSWVAVFFYKIHAAITVADLFDKEGTLIVKEPLPQKKKQTKQGLIALHVAWVLGCKHFHVDFTVSFKTRNCISQKTIQCKKKQQPFMKRIVYF